MQLLGAFRLYIFLIMAQYILGWDIGGTKCAAVVGTANGEVVSRAEWSSASTAGPELMIKEFRKQAAILAGEFGPFDGLGVSVGGPLNMKTGVVLSPPHLPGWSDVPSNPFSRTHARRGYQQGPAS